MKSVKVTKLSRALNLPLTAKAARHMERRPHPPGQHGKTKRPSTSTFARQLLEKQRLKAQYHVSETQLRNYFLEAQRTKGATGSVLVQMLESRLDAFAFRAGFAPTIYSARQLISHCHIIVNGKSINKPGHKIKAGDVICLREKSKEHPLVKSHFPQAIRPDYLQVDLAAVTATKVREPQRNEVPITCEEQLIVEFFSR